MLRPGSARHNGCGNPARARELRRARERERRAETRPERGGVDDYFCPMVSFDRTLLAYADIVCSEVVTTFSSFRFSELSQPI